ncbi:MAG: FtsW/RodA/SpoVE family cell cycle protein [Candidatus Shapirobacteria bacterium]|jgi:cell division protein FtsW
MLQTLLNRIRSPIFFIPLGLSLFGLLMLSLSSLSEGYATTGDQYYFIKKQAVWLTLGTVVMQLVASVSIQRLKFLTPILYYFSVFLLILVFLPGFSQQALGAKRWLNFNGFTIQPSEFVKMSAVLFFSHLFSRPQTNHIKFFILYLIPPLFFILIEPSLSNAIILFLEISFVFFIASNHLKHLFFTWLVGLILTILLIVVYPYRLNRVIGFLKPSYHTTQLGLAISTGGFIGKGLANSDQKYLFIPKVSTDSIFAVIAEETGFVGCLVILICYLYLVNYLFKLSQASTDPFDAIFFIGVGSLICLQAFINLSAILALAPLTGVTLPFISYGGSSLLTLFILLGIAQSIESRLLLYSDNAPKRYRPKNTNHRHSPHPSH